LISAALYPDSPFQTPLASVLRPLVLKLLEPLTALLHQIQNGLSGTWMAIWKFLQQQPISPPLPLFRHDKDPDPPTSNPFATESFPEASPAVPAVLWLLETSTNPDVISAAADMAADLQWPLHADLDVALFRLQETFWACFIRLEKFDFQVRDGSIQHAITCGQAYGTMSISSRKNTGNLIYFRRDLLPTMAVGTESLQLAQLHTVFNALKGNTKFLHSVRTQSVMHWALHVLPHTEQGLRHFVSDLNTMLEYASSSQTAFTKQNYADCLLLLNMMVGFEAHPDTLVLKDKRSQPFLP
jgi:hypothetical protein